MAVLPFHEFCPKVLGLHLTPGQNVVAKIAFGDSDPIDLLGEERSLALEMFGGQERVPADARRYIVLRLGRGSGKTTICAAYAVYQAVTHDLQRCGPGDTAYVITVAPDKETAKLSIRMAREMVRGNNALERLVVGDEQQSITLRRPDGRPVKIEAFAATRGGYAVRGRTIIAFLLDEAEFFTSNSESGAAQGREYAVNDRELFRAMKPRLLPKGRGMLISTPWPVETLMGELFERNWGKAQDAVAVKATTLQVRGDDPDIVAMVEDELKKDPENARRELFCDVDGLFGGEFFDVGALNASMDSLLASRGVLSDGLWLGPRNPKWPVAIGCDLGFTRDSSALVAVQFNGTHYEVCALQELRPKPGQPLKPSKVIEDFTIRTKQYEANGIIADGYYREALHESLSANQLVLIDAPPGSNGKADVFQRTRTVLHDSLIKLPDNALGRRLVQQAKLVTAKPAPGGTTTIKVPRKIGLGHGDLVSAWTLAVHNLAYDQLATDKLVFEPGTPEWNREFNRRVLVAESKQQDDYLKTIQKQARGNMSKRDLYKLGFASK
jgi:hypothetical protein